MVRGLLVNLINGSEHEEGDEVEMHVTGDRAFDIARDRSRARTLARIRAYRKELPPDWKLDRNEAKPGEFGGGRISG